MANELPCLCHILRIICQDLHWKLFNEIAGNNFRVVNNQNPEDKLEQKIELLQFLKNNGVWLLDCSIVGLYQNGQKPSVGDINEILITSYLNY